MRHDGIREVVSFPNFLLKPLDVQWYDSLRSEILTKKRVLFSFLEGEKREKGEGRVKL